VLTPEVISTSGVLLYSPQLSQASTLYLLGKATVLALHRSLAGRR